MKFHTVLISSLLEGSLLLTLPTHAAAQSLRGGVPNKKELQLESASGVRDATPVMPKSARKLPSYETEAIAVEEDSYTVPFFGNCEIGQGFDLYFGCSKYASPFDTSTWTVVKGDTSCSSGTEYIKTIASSQDLSSAIDSVSKAEGSYSSGAFNAKASATVSYMTSKHISSNSVSFYLGQSQVLNKDYLHLTDSKLALSSNAMTTLKDDPDSFLEQYGPYFIQTIYNGATFSGSLNIYRSTFSDSTDLSTYAKISASDVFFSASASNSYHSAYSNSGSSLTFEFDGQYTGATGIVQICSEDEPCTAADPTVLGTAYDNWVKSVNNNSSGTSMKMQYANWKQIPQVADFIDTLSSSDKEGKYKDICYPPTIEPQTLEKINNEALQTYYVKTALQQAKDYVCYTEGGVVATQIDALYQNATSHYKQFNSLTVDDIVAIQDGSDKTFFIATSLQNQYNDLIASNPSCGKIDCNAYCGGYAQPFRKNKVLVDGKGFRSAVSDYISDPDSSPYGSRIGCWDVSVVTDMGAAFWGQDTFNEPLNCWDVSNVETLENAFHGAQSFNQDLDKWDTSKVTNMLGLFMIAGSFNGNITTWDTSSVTNMYSTFQAAKSFNQDISKWDVKQVTVMQNMFGIATSFDQDLSGWDISSVSSMDSMFYYAENFDQNLCAWQDHMVANDVGYMFTSSGCPIKSDPNYQAWCQTCS